MISTIRTMFISLLLLCLIAVIVYATVEEEYYLESPCFSPDGTKIVFVSDALTGDLDILKINTDGTGLLNLAHTAGKQHGCPVWSPDGSTIAYDYRDWGPPELEAVMLMNPDGSNKRRITNEEYLNCEPAWLPDSARLIVTTARYIGADLILITASGSEIRYIAAKRPGESMASCSPDGMWVVYEITDTFAGLNQDEVWTNIWRRRIDDISIPPVQLTSGQYMDIEPKYSPDGTKIAFASNRSGSGLRIYTMNPDGSNMTLIPIGLLESASSPTWSPDGTKIAFVGTTYDENTEDVYNNIYTIRLDGTDLTQITHTVAKPAFSPEGGEYTGAQTVTIGCATPGAVIRYTTDGTDPTESSPIYSSPVTVDASKILKAKAWKTDYFPSFTASADYVIQ